MNLIELRDVAKSVQLVDGSLLEILRGVNLTIQAGQHISVVGRSGSGKSTLLNMLGLLDEPTSGTVLVEDKDSESMRAKERDAIRGGKIGFVFQQFNLLPNRTALENVEMPLLYSDDFFLRREKAIEALEVVGLGERLENAPEQLSGGEQQRVAIARALVRKPSVILADEPTGALDIETGQQVMGMLDSLVTDSGAALVTITHDPQIAKLADAQYLLEAGALSKIRGNNQESAA